MKLSEIHDMWDADSPIPRNKYEEASIASPMLHSKYIRLLSHEKAILFEIEMEQKEILKRKQMYYTGELSEEDIKLHGYDFDPFNGLKKQKTKNKLEMYYETDKEIQASQRKVENQMLKIGALNEIITSIKWRHQTIRNAIEWRRFESGD